MDGVLYEVVEAVGLDNIVLETDSPYLSPDRGKKNEPCNILIVANYLADLYDVSFEKVSDITTKNVFSLFDLDGRL